MDRLIDQVAAFPDIDLDAMDITGLDDRDAALAIAIEQAVGRRWLTLETILQSRLDRDWSTIQPEIRAAMLVGAAQILLLDRIPTHAAVDDAVEWTKRRVRPKAGGFVNAVLRRVSELPTGESEPFDPDQRDHLPKADGSAMILNDEIFAEEPAHRIAQQTAHADALVAHWTATMGFARTIELCRHDLVHPPIIVTDVPPDTADCVPHDEPGHFVFTGSMSALRAIVDEHPLARVQDAGTSKALHLAAELSPRVIIDFCAGRGTKSKQLAVMFPEAEVVASDPDPVRFAVLQQLAYLIPNITAVRPEALGAYQGRADLVVLDLPCSNTGVLPRRPEAKAGFRIKRLRSLESLQRSIMAQALPLRAESGHVLQITCSLERMENEDQSAHLERWFPLRVREQQRARPTGLPGDPATGYRDGGYAALLAPAS